MSRQLESKTTTGMAGVPEPNAPRRMGMYVLIDEQSTPRLYSALARAAEGKPRVQRFRDLALGGLTLEMLSNSIDALPRRPVGDSGSAGVFDDPLD
jgi:hypothetical protein